MLELCSGELFAGCKIVCVCGKGGYGTVYLAENAAGEKVALKIINTNEQKRELEGIKNYLPVSHQSPYLLKVFHVGIEQNELFLIMEAADSLADSKFYLPDTLAKRLQLYGRLQPDCALDITRKISFAVKTLHDAKLIHRDIKPDNVIFVKGEPKLSDPGLVCSSERTITLVGTLGFLPPECFSGMESNTSQSDIYALGKLFYCTVTGESPGRFPYLPRDLSSPVCRKLLPVFLKSCNAKKKKRYTDIVEFQRDLPARLPRPGVLFQLEERFRIWRLMHCYLWNTVLASIFAVILLSVCTLVYQHHRKMRLAEQSKILLAEKRDFENKINSDNQYIALQLRRIAGEERCRELMKKCTSLPEDPVKAVSQCQSLQRQLNTLAVRNVEENKNIQSAIKRIAVQKAFLKSPLGKFLTPEQKKSLENELSADEKKNQKQHGSRMKLEKPFAPDSSGIFEFAYIPPGDFISSDGKQKRIDYPFWVAPQKLNIRQFSRMCRFQPPQSNDQELPAVRFLWNDLLYGCRNANVMFQIVAPFLPGYIVRPLTDDEWTYCASRTKKSSGKNTNAFGLYDLGGKPGEIICSGKRSFRDSVPVRSGVSGKGYNEVAFYQSFDKSTGTRLAIAPGSVDFYKNNLMIGSPQHIVHNGRHYEFFGHLCANFSRKNAEDICRLLGGRLAALDSPELIQKIYNTASPVINYNVCVAADFKDGKWVWHNGKAVKNAPPPPGDGEYFVMTGKKFTTKVTRRYLSFVCEWSEEEFQARKNCKQRFAKFPFPAVKTFQEDGKEYVFFKMLMSYPHLCRRFAELLGGKLAEPENSALQKKISEHLKEFDDHATLLGGYWHNGKFFWSSSKNEIKEPLSLTGQVIDPAPSLSVPALKNGKLCAIQLPEQFLMEFPSP